MVLWIVGEQVQSVTRPVFGHRHGATQKDIQEDQTWSLIRSDRDFHRWYDLSWWRFSVDRTVVHQQWSMHIMCSTATRGSLHCLINISVVRWYSVEIFNGSSLNVSTSYDISRVSRKSSPSSSSRRVWSERKVNCNPRSCWWKFTLWCPSRDISSC
jgi:hypothetical protein